MYPPAQTLEGKPRQRRAGGGATGTWPQLEDKLLFLLIFQKTNPLQTMPGLPFQLSPPQTNYWIHPLLPVLPRAFAALGMAPERDASRVATNPLALEGAPAMAIDGTERRRQRPTNAAQQREQYSGKKKTHTAKNLLLVTEHPDKGIDLGPTVAGKKHAKKAAEEEAIAYPTHATLDKDTGFQGYAPAGVVTHQPQKTPGPGGERGGQGPQSSHLQRTRDRRQCDCRGETGSHCQRCLTSDHRGHLGSRDGDCVRLAQSPRELSSPVPRI